MQVEFRVNGKLAIVLTPENTLHKVILNAMAAESEKGASFKITSDVESDDYTISSTRA